eukprot:3630960-Rhodomonas_salina.1
MASNTTGETLILKKKWGGVTWGGVTWAGESTAGVHKLRADPAVGLAGVHLRLCPPGTAPYAVYCICCCWLWGSLGSIFNCPPGTAPYAVACYAQSCTVLWHRAYHAMRSTVSCCARYCIVSYCSCSMLCALYLAPFKLVHMAPRLCP